MFYKLFVLLNLFALSSHAIPQCDEKAQSWAEFYHQNIITRGASSAQVHSIRLLNELKVPIAGWDEMDAGERQEPGNGPSVIDTYKILIGKSTLLVQMDRGDNCARVGIKEITQMAPVGKEKRSCKSKVAQAILDKNIIDNDTFTLQKEFHSLMGKIQVWPGDQQSKSMKLMQYRITGYHDSGNVVLLATMNASNNCEPVLLSITDHFYH